MAQPGRHRRHQRQQGRRCHPCVRFYNRRVPQDGKLQVRALLVRLHDNESSGHMEHLPEPYRSSIWTIFKGVRRAVHPVFSEQRFKHLAWVGVSVERVAVMDGLVGVGPKTNAGSSADPSPRVCCSCCASLTHALANSRYSSASPACDESRCSWSFCFCGSLSSSHRRNVAPNGGAIRVGSEATISFISDDEFLTEDNAGWKTVRGNMRR